MKLCRGKLKEATEALITEAENEVISREIELENLKKEVKMLRNKLEEEERR